MKEKLQEWAGVIFWVMIIGIGFAYWWLSTMKEHSIAREQASTENGFLIKAAQAYRADTNFTEKNSKMLYYYQDKLNSNPRVVINRFLINDIHRVEDYYMVNCQKTFSLSEDADFYLKFDLRCKQEQFKSLTNGIDVSDIDGNYLTGQSGCIIAYLDSVNKKEDTIRFGGFVLTVFNSKNIYNE